jgi:spermidine synthase
VPRGGRPHRCRRSRSIRSEGQAKASALLPLVALLFAGSGCSALIYEIVWYQLLQFAIGSTSVSLGILLATFMGGLCLGSILLPRVLGARAAHPLLIYAGIEFAIGILGLLELLIIPSIGSLYLAGASSGLTGMLLRGAVAAICLLPPTMLMGASLPAIVRWVKSSPRGISWWGMLYGANTAGAVFGCLFAGFYLMRLFDVNIATFAAAAINVTVAVLSFAFAKLAPAECVTEDTPGSTRSSPPRTGWTVHASIALSGACALGAEVVWMRLMGLTLGATVYAFSIILAVFLSGLALGTALASSRVANANARFALGLCQLGAAFGIAWAAYVIANWFPYWPINPTLSTDPAFTFELDLVRSVWAMLPAAMLWGASFPFAFAAAAPQGGDAGRTVGGIYAANTLGAILGALAVSLVLIPWIGTQNTQRVLLALAAVSGILILMPLIRETRSLRMEMSAGAALGLLVLLIAGLDAVPGELIAYGRRVATTAGQSEVLYTAEGRNTSIAVTRWKEDGAYQFHVAGKVEASTEIYDMKLQRMLGHLPALMLPEPKSVLVVGFGGGVTAGTFTRYPSVSRILICELEPLIPRASTRYFAAQNYNVMSDKRTEIVFDDARHYVATMAEKFDIITSDPIHPFVKGSATLYSKEYFEMVRAHLNPGGVVSQWLPLYESDAATVKSEIATFAAVFPYVILWANLNEGKGYDMVLTGQMEPPRIDLGAVDEKLARAEYLPVLQSLDDVQMADPDNLFLTYAGDANALAQWLKGASINRDKDLRLQYLAGLALNRADEDTIYREIRQYWTPPVSLFTGSEARLDALFTKMTQPPAQSPNGE